MYLISFSELSQAPTTSCIYFVSDGAWLIKFAVLYVSETYVEIFYLFASKLILKMCDLNGFNEQNVAEM